MLRSDHAQLGMQNFQRGFLAPQSAFLIPCQLLEFVQPKNYYPMLTQTSSTITVGKWSKNEQKLYIEFLISNRQLFVSKSVRKSRKVFLNMSQIIKTRTAEQCRTHHQKMLKYNSTIDDILNSYSQLISNKNHQRSAMHGLDSESPDVEMQGSFYAMDIIEPNRLKIEINVDAMLEY